MLEPTGTFAGNYCDQMGELFSMIWPFTTKIAQLNIKIAKIDSKFCTTGNKPSKITILHY